MGRVFSFEPVGPRRILQDHECFVRVSQLFCWSQLQQHETGIAWPLQLHRAVDLLGAERQLGRHFHRHSQAQDSLPLGRKVGRNAERDKPGLKSADRIGGHNSLDPMGGDQRAR